MYVRCAECQASTWLPPLGQEPVETLRCKSCGLISRLHPRDALSSVGAQQQHETARDFAEKHMLDLPSAYSVLLGIATIEQMRTTDGAPVSSVSPEPSEAPRPPKTEVGKRTNYDWAFREAVARGYLTYQQAVQRGNRNAYAATIARRHELPMKFAYMIADNKLTISSAVQAHLDEKREEIRLATADDTRKTRQRMFVAVFAFLSVCAVGYYSWYLWNEQIDHSRRVAAMAPLDDSPGPEPEEPESSNGSTTPVEVRSNLMAAVSETTDDLGRITKIVGPDPRTVLRAYCKSTGVTPLKLVLSRSTLSGARVGIFRDYENLESYFSIRIHRDPATRRWVTGDGVNPVPRSQVSDLPDGPGTVDVGE